MAPRITQSVYMAVGEPLTDGTGAMFDVSSYVDLEVGVRYDHGRESEFDETPPGTFWFTLDNADGRFTPDNPSSPLSTKVTEGIDVAWQCAGGATRVVLGRVRSIQPAYPGSQAAWAQVVITCDDALGQAGRTSIDNIPDALAARDVDGGQNPPLLFWKLDDDEGAGSAAESTGSLLGALVTAQSVVSSTVVAEFGVENAPGMPGTACTLTAAAGETNFLQTVPRLGGTAFDYTELAASTNVGVWGIWVLPGSTFTLTITHAYPAGGFVVSVTPASVSITGGTGSTATITLTPVARLAPLYVQVTFSNDAGVLTAFLEAGGSSTTATYSDAVIGTSVGTMTNAQKQPTQVSLKVVASTATVSRLLHTARPTYSGQFSSPVTPSRLIFLLNRIGSRFFIYDEGNLSSALQLPLGVRDMSVLDALNLLVKAEQGSLSVSSFGPLATPSSRISVAGVDRPSTGAFGFSLAEETQGAPNVARDVTNLVSVVSVDTPTDDVVVSNPDLELRAGWSTASESLLLANRSSATLWGQDRLIRGANVRMRVEKITVDNVVTPTDRSGDLLSMVLGEKYAFFDVPAGQVGYGSWFGYFLGASEWHSLTANEFELHFAQTGDSDPLFDTAVFMSDGELSLTAGISSSATSMTVATTGARLENPATIFDRYTLLVDQEMVTVTAASAATPQVLTVMRGQNGSTAAAHTTAAVIQSSPVYSGSFFAF